MEQTQHALALRSERRKDLFAQGKDSSLGGSEQHAETGFATEPAGPLQAEMVEVRGHSVTGQRTFDQLRNVFHLRAPLDHFWVGGCAPNGPEFSLGNGRRD